MRTQADRNEDLAIGRELERKDAEIDRMRAALEDARRDMISVRPQRGSKSPKRLILGNAIARVEAALGYSATGELTPDQIRWLREQADKRRQTWAQHAVGQSTTETK